MQGNHIRFAQLLELHVTNVITKKFVNEQLTPLLMRQIREAIRAAIENVFVKSKHNLSNAALTWLTDQYFKAIKLNGEMTMSDQVVIHEYKLSQLPYHDIELLRNLFNETAMAPELEKEYRTRSLA